MFEVSTINALDSRLYPSVSVRTAFTPPHRHTMANRVRPRGDRWWCIARLLAFVSATLAGSLACFPVSRR